MKILMILITMLNENTTSNVNANYNECEVSNDKVI